jgi:hypothetical protein
LKKLGDPETRNPWVSKMWASFVTDFNYIRTPIEALTIELIGTKEEETKKRKNPNKSKDKRLGLINYEGDCIYAKKTPEGNILIYDQYNSLIDVADFLEMSNWIEGVIPFKDSKGKEWFYPEAHKEAKPTVEDIFNFIKK